MRPVATGWAQAGVRPDPPPGCPAPQLGPVSAATVEADTVELTTRDGVVTVPMRPAGPHVLGQMGAAGIAMVFVLGLFAPGCHAFAL